MAKMVQARRRQNLKKIQKCGIRARILIFRVVTEKETVN